MAVVIALAAAIASGQQGAKTDQERAVAQAIRKLDNERI
jgi:hypothetical protein